MAAQILTCQPADSFCKYYAFSGFGTPSNKYASIAFCDWDCCLAGQGLTGDLVNGGSLGTIHQPTSWPTQPDTCFDYDGNPVNCCEEHNPDGLVDGHIVITAINGCYAQVTEATGLYASGPFQIDTVFKVSDVKDLINMWGGGLEITTSDYLGYARGFSDFSCGQKSPPPDDFCFPIFQFDPSPNNA
jgi:hypothetical protein